MQRNNEAETFWQNTDVQTANIYKNLLCWAKALYHI